MKVGVGNSSRADKWDGIDDSQQAGLYARERAWTDAYRIAGTDKKCACQPEPP